MKALRLKDPRATLRFHDIPGAGPPLVCLHGLGCAASSDFPRLAVELAPLGRRLVLVDLLGSGFSDRPASFSYTVDAHARVVVALVEALGLEGVSLFGHSMGGSIAIAAAALIPPCVRHVVVAEPNLDPGGGLFSRAIAAYDEQDYVARGHQTMIRAAVIGGNDVWAGTLAASSAVAVHREAVSLVAGCEPSWRALLVADPSGRTVVFGERSLPDPDTDALARAGIAVAVVPDAGHSMMWDNPAGLARALVEATARPRP